MSAEDPTWIVLARDLSDTISVPDQPSVTAALILDAGSGLIRGMSVGATVRQACAAAVRAALTAPAGTGPTRPPATVIYDEVHAGPIIAALGDVVPTRSTPVLLPGPIPAQAEDLFDSAVGHLAGRAQPDDLPGPEDWALLYGAGAAYCRAAPWRLWSDADRLTLTVDLDGQSTRYDVVVYGNEGIQRGLAILPAEPAPGSPVTPRSARTGRPDHGDARGGTEQATGRLPWPAGSGVLWLDPVAEVPGHCLAKALRYGWPPDAELAPLTASVLPQGLCDIDATTARHLSLALVAVVAHQGPRSSGTSVGTVALADDTLGLYTISDSPAADPAAPTARPPGRPTSGTPASLPPTIATPPPAPTVPAPVGALRPMRTARLRVTMREVTPPVVRVVDVPATATLPELHDLLQAAIGWTDSHLHEFVTPDEVRYGRPDLDWEDDARDETTATLRDLPARFTYRYDFGDRWQHDVEVTGRGGPQPGCPDGEGACPPEDCGGSHGYAELLEALADPGHPDHDRLRTWASHWSPTWTQADREAADRLVRATVGVVPASVRILLELIGDQVRLTPGGRLPRTLVRAVQRQRPDWGFTSRPASLEEDLFPLSYLHDLLRRVGVLRLVHGVLRPTKAAEDDLQIVRRLRRAVEPDGYDDILAGVAVAHLAARGSLPRPELAALTHPWLDRWSVNGRPVTPEDIDDDLIRAADRLQALDLIRSEGRIWHPGPSAETLLPRATSLADLFRRAPAAG